MTPQFSLQADPFEIDRELTLDYIERFFTFVDKQISLAIPKASFVPWVRNCKHKSLSDQMMIYAVMAVGSVFVEDSTPHTWTSVLSENVQEGINQCGGILTFQLAATYLLSTLLAISRGEYKRAWNSSGSTIRTILGLQFNTEAGISAASRSGAWESLFEITTLVDSPLSDYDLCLPRIGNPFQSREAIDLESLRPLETAECNPGPADRSGDLETFGHLIQIAAMFHEVVKFSYHQQYHRTSADVKTFLSFYGEIETRLNIWKKSLHKAPNQSGKKLCFFNLQILYHYANLHLHRYVCHAALDPVANAGHVRAAYSNAHQILELVQYLNSDEKTKNSLTDLKITSPCIEYAITTGLDVLTAAGKVSDLINSGKIMSVIASGLEVLDDLARFSYSAQRQRDLVKRRLTTMLKVMTRRSWDRRRAFYFKNPILLRYGMDQDIVYGITRLEYIQAMDLQDGITADDFFELMEDA
ncbi:uncharacterized protein A1O9_00316 [Exophiala aquamarina CBS 119918]|uniref:Transcription factor domain-containing protein n=1 Tax=Exophiala aquamarina CBS 119918 TaxID=1182545 RepID=A0A072PQI2_9EURO|nr:uncharacterized protein A1O9_00316 [Exophiala aquamarina CBS 119918]KEF62344.1 hypothetical protein A1O9_00316 [Exophiala aquamarina CBS 119918]